jgi:hypothetical protein
MPSVDAIKQQAQRIRRHPIAFGPLIISLEYRRCGKNCSGCPHGPYIYARARGQERTYLGKASPK